MKFRRKISVVEAYHFTKDVVNRPKDWPLWLLESCNTNYKHGCYFYETLVNNPDNDTFTIQYSNGSIRYVNYGDWIVNDDSKITALSPEEFHNIYEQIKTN